MRREIRDLIHQGHQGIEKCKSSARQAVYCPGMNHELTVLVSQRATCINHRNRHQKESLIQHQIPDQPWVKVGTDLFTIYNRDYLIVVDYHSKFIEVAHFPKPTDSPAIVRAMKKIFSRHLLPTKEPFKATTDYDDLQTLSKPSDANKSTPPTTYMVDFYGFPPNTDCNMS